MKRLVRWSAPAFVVLAVLIVAAFRLSPSPSVAIIAWAFARGERASEAALLKHVPPGIVDRRNIAYGDHPDEVLDLYRHNGARGSQPAIVWVHGGGFVAGTKEGVANYLRVLAGQGYTTIAVEYSRGSGTRYPRPVEQVNEALAFLSLRAAEFGIDPNALVLAGDSAGAQIASQVALLTTDPAYARRLGIAPKLKSGQLRAVLLLSGAFNLASLNADTWFIRTVTWAYSGIRDFRQDPRFELMSVTRYVTSTFPPSFISSGNEDPLTPQAVAFAGRLEQLGVRNETLFFAPDREPSLPHEYQFNLDDPAGREALTRMLGFLEVMLAPAPPVRPSPEGFKKSPGTSTLHRTKSESRS